MNGAFRRAIQFSVVLLCAFVYACKGESAETSRAASSSDPKERGKEAIRHFGCGSCHTIPGIANAKGEVASPLTGFAKRTFIVGQVPNTPENLVMWLMSPQAIDPATAMPYLGISKAQAQDIASYLYTLR